MKNRAALVIAIFIVAASSLARLSVARADNAYVVTNGEGGNVYDHIEFWRRVSSKYDRVVIDGPCQSACTLVLGVMPLDRICITSRGRLGFHAAHQRGDRNAKNERLTAIMRQTYPRAIRSWLDNIHAFDSTKLKWVSGRKFSFIKHCSRPAGFKQDLELLSIIQRHSRN